MPPRRPGPLPSRARTALLFFAKLPVPGRVKTRLARTVGAAAAAALAEAFLRDGAERWSAIAGVAPVLAADEPEAPFWRRTFRPPWRVEPQGPGDLGGRLARAFTRELALYDRAVAIGSDHPALPADAFALFLEQPESAVWPARDGGFAAILLSRRDARLVFPPDGSRGLFDGIEWSTPRVLEQTIERAASLGARLERVAETDDVDAEEDLERLARELAARDRSAAGFPRHTWEALRSLGRGTPA